MLRGRGMRKLGSLVISFACGVLVLQAQQTASTLVGSVTDPSGAIVSGATVAVTNNETGVRRDAISYLTGNYSLPFLVAGEYKVAVSSSGFRPKDVPRLILQLGQTARVD